MLNFTPNDTFVTLKAMGENKKSSASPMEITKLDKLYILATGMGVSSSVFIARNETDADKAAINRYPVLDQSE